MSSWFRFGGGSGACGAAHSVRSGLGSVAKDYRQSKKTGPTTPFAKVNAVGLSRSPNRLNKIEPKAQQNTEASAAAIPIARSSTCSPPGKSRYALVCSVT